MAARRNLARHFDGYAAVALVAAAVALVACSERPMSQRARRRHPSLRRRRSRLRLPLLSAPASPPSYRASLEEGITFAKPGYPDFVASTEGISHAEQFGRWTDGPKAVIAFKDPLPKKFELVIKGAAYGPNIDQPVKVSAGPVSQEIVFESDLNKDAQTRRMIFSLEQPVDRIEFQIPKPTQPANGDVRKLGIALIELKIEPGAK